MAHGLRAQVGRSRAIRMRMTRMVLGLTLCRRPVRLVAGGQNLTPHLAVGRVKKGAAVPLLFHPRFEVLVSEVGVPEPGLLGIGAEARPPLAVLPGSSALFLARSKQVSACARGPKLLVACCTVRRRTIARPCSRRRGARQGVRKLSACRPLDLAAVGLDTQMVQARCRRGGRNRHLLGD